VLRAPGTLAFTTRFIMPMLNRQTCLAFFLGLVLCLAAGQVAAQQTGVVKNDGVLRADPSATAASVGSVSANSKVEILDRKAFWLKIRSNGTTGWVKMSSVATEGGSAGNPGALAGLATGRLGSGNIVSASGTRGLSSEELKSARPNFASLKQVQGMAISGEEASRFAAAGGLMTRSIEYVRPTVPAGAQPPDSTPATN